MFARRRPVVLTYRFRATSCPVCIAVHENRLAVVETAPPVSPSLPDSGTDTPVKAKFWPWLEPFSERLETLSSCSLLVRQRKTEQLWLISVQQKPSMPTRE